MSERESWLYIRESGMWQVVTASHIEGQNQCSAARGGWEQRLPVSEIDELIEALATLAPPSASLVAQPTRVPKTFSSSVPAAPPPQNLPYFSRKAAVAVNDEVISQLEIPRAANAPAEPPLAPAVREQLLKLRTNILLAVEQRQLRSVLICSADAAENSASVTANLSKLLAEYERLKVAYIEVIEDDRPLTSQRKILPFGYTFQIRQTKVPNLSEIASSLGPVRLNDWLQWWSPAIALQEMGKLFDVVLISAPAITAHSDVALLAGAVDGVILAATEHTTTYASLAAAQQQLRAAQAHILGVTLNQAPPAVSPLAAVKSRVRELIEAMVKNK